MARTTKAEYLALMKHAIHAESPATGVMLETVLNQAGQRLFDMKPWPWLISDPVELYFTEGSNEIDLPADFGGMTACAVKNNTFQRVEFVDHNLINRLRNNQTVASNLIFYVCAQPWSKQVTPGVSPTPKLLLDRVATVDGSPTFMLVYKRDFVPLVDDASVPDMPQSMDWALTCLCRAMAWGLENDGEHPDMGRAMSVIEEQWVKWRVVQPNLGPIRGGAGDRLPRRITSADAARFRI